MGVIAHRVRAVRNRLSSKPRAESPFGQENQRYWADRNVTNHQRFVSKEESLAALAWRNDQYLFYGDWLPYESFDNQSGLDFGCGPGHDLVALHQYANTSGLIGMDVSTVSVEEAKQRLMLHGGQSVRIEAIPEGGKIPLDTSSLDFVISSGVLHHIFDLDSALSEIHRVLKPGGRLLTMVYNRDSVWAHLYVPYLRQIKSKIDPGLSFGEAFRRSTDGADCPKSVCYRPAEFESILADRGFRGGYTGAAISVHEMGLLPYRFDAIQDSGLAEEHREFLVRLTFDEFGRPLHEGRVAGIDGFFEFVT